MPNEIQTESRRWFSENQLWAAVLAMVAVSTGGCAERSVETTGRLTVAETPTEARAGDGRYISWVEHRIDDEELGGIAIRGGDGLRSADFDRDGYPDFVSVHEDSDHVRIAFGTADPDEWELVTLAEGAKVPAAEDADVSDLNGDGLIDVIVACEGGHFIYFQNPGETARSGEWPSVIPTVAARRGSFIRVSLADLDGNGDLEVIAANKGTDPTNEGVASERPTTELSWFEVPDDPLRTDQWEEHMLTRVRVPIIADPVDLDGDGDIDIVGGSRGESRIFWFENLGGMPPDFREHPIEIEGTSAAREAGDVHITGFALQFIDFSGDGRLDIVLAEMPTGAAMTRSGGEPPHPGVYWLEQPSDRNGGWKSHRIGDAGPDMVAGLQLADIDGDADQDIVIGGYSLGPRLQDGEAVTAADPVGRVAWFENSGDPSRPWRRHDISRRKRGMFDEFVPMDLDDDGDLDLVATRGNSAQFDGVFWLEQVRTEAPVASFRPARAAESQHMSLPPER